ncbi:mucin-associated surface protein (MASP) [Trypanosoma cruzi]|nr:mucin-associated surface protein (MASP) [Trypanosoma cruzi]
MVCCTSWTPVEGEGHGATCPPLRCWRTAYLWPRYAGGTIIFCRMKATCSCPLPAMHGLLVMLFGCFCRTTSLQMVARDVWLQSLNAGFFFLTGGVEELQALADFIVNVRAGVSATRSAAVGKTSFTLAVEAGVKEANVRARHPTFCTVLLRRLDLIASHIEPSPCGRNVVSKGSRGRRARQLHSSVEVSGGKKCEPFGI